MVAKYRVIAHSAYDREHLAFMGISDLGTPIWLNRAVAEAEYRIAIGRIAPHGDMGYEGGAKMIVPGVAALETVMHNHRMFFSPLAGVGTLDVNPARRDVDNISGVVGLHFILNFVSHPFWRRATPPAPIKAFAGHYLAAHHAGVAWGDRNVWGVEIGEKVDVTIVAGASGYAARNAAAGTKDNGTIVIVAPDEHTAQRRPVDDIPSREATVLNRLRSLSLEDALRVNARCAWEQPEDWLQMMRIAAGKAKRYRYHHRYLHTHGRIDEATLNERGWEHGGAPETAIEQALSRYGEDARVLILPEGRTTLPLERFHLYPV